MALSNRGRETTAVKLVFIYLIISTGLQILLIKQFFGKKWKEEERVLSDTSDPISQSALAFEATWDVKRRPLRSTLFTLPATGS